MGCCVSGGEQKPFQNVSGNQESKSQEPVPRSRAQPSSGREREARDQNRQAAESTGRIQYLQNPNVEKILQGQVTGEGIKKTPSYDTPLSRSEIEKWRKEFWETRTQGGAQIWQLLRNSCEEDHETAEAIILAAQLQMPQSSLTLVIDENGVYYRVPICCINDPVNYGVLGADTKLKAKPIPKEQFFEAIKIRSSKGDCDLKLSNLLQILEVKQKYIAKLEDKTLTPEAIRFFCLGKELKDDLCMYTYEIVDGIAIQAMFKKM